MISVMLASTNFSESPMSTSQPVLQISNLTKHYGGVKA